MRMKERDEKQKQKKQHKQEFQSLFKENGIFSHAVSILGRFLLPRVVVVFISGM